jgi:hypothetical protein
MDRTTIIITSVTVVSIATLYLYYIFRSKYENLCQIDHSNGDLGYLTQYDSPSQELFKEKPKIWPVVNTYTTSLNKFDREDSRDIFTDMKY